MATHKNAPPWSGNMHALLVRAADDQVFRDRAQLEGFHRDQISKWIEVGDVPKTYRAALRSLVDNWYFHSSIAVTGHHR